MPIIDDGAGESLEKLEYHFRHSLEVVDALVQLQETLTSICSNCHRFAITPTANAELCQKSKDMLHVRAAAWPAQQLLDSLDKVGNRASAATCVWCKEVVSVADAATSLQALRARVTDFKPECVFRV